MAAKKRKKVGTTKKKTRGFGRKGARGRRFPKRFGRALPKGQQRALLVAFEAGKAAAEAPIGPMYGPGRSEFLRRKRAVAAGRKRRATAKTSKVSKRRTRKGGETVTAASVIKKATRAAMQRWLCEGPKRSGCGSRGRVVSGRGSFSRVR